MELELQGVAGEGASDGMKCCWMDKAMPATPCDGVSVSSYNYLLRNFVQRSDMIKFSGLKKS